MHSLFNALAAIVPLRHKNRIRTTQLRYMRLKRLTREALIHSLEVSHELN